MTQPIPITVTRYRCPHCPRSAANKTRMRDHITRCWHNPANRGCKTCAHFDALYGWGDDCNVGVDLTGRPACKACNGIGQLFNRLGPTECDCGGDGQEIKPGPIVDCDRWQPPDPS